MCDRRAGFYLVGANVRVRSVHPRNRPFEVSLISLPGPNLETARKSPSGAASPAITNRPALSSLTIVSNSEQDEHCG